MAADEVGDRTQQHYHGRRERQSQWHHRACINGHRNKSFCVLATNAPSRNEAFTSRPQAALQRLTEQASQRSLHNAPIFRLLLKVAVNGTHQCDSYEFLRDRKIPTMAILYQRSSECQSGQMRDVLPVITHPRLLSGVENKAGFPELGHFCGPRCQLQRTVLVYDS